MFKNVNILTKLTKLTKVIHFNLLKLNHKKLYCYLLKYLKLIMYCQILRKLLQHLNNIQELKSN